MQCLKIFSAVVLQLEDSCILQKLISKNTSLKNFQYCGNMYVCNSKLCNVHKIVRLDYKMLRLWT
jgi:hypothetical protein